MRGSQGKHGWPKQHAYVVQECLAISVYCYLCGAFEDVLPDYVKLVEKPAGACRKRYYLACPGCACLHTHLFLPAQRRCRTAMPQVPRAHLCVATIRSQTSPPPHLTAALSREAHGRSLVSARVRS